MEFIKKFLGFVLLLVALGLAFVNVANLTAPHVEFFAKMVQEEWFLKVLEYALEWGMTAIVVLGLSRMLAINNKVAMFLTFVLWVALSAVVVLALNFNAEYVELLTKIGLAK
jgi:hypothetical protein